MYIINTHPFKMWRQYRNLYNPRLVSRRVLPERHAIGGVGPTVVCNHVDTFSWLSKRSSKANAITTSIHLRESVVCICRPRAHRFLPRVSEWYGSPAELSGHGSQFSRHGRQFSRHCVDQWDSHSVTDFGDAAHRVWGQATVKDTSSFSR